MKTEIQKLLEQLAYKRSTPFCYSDYIECPTGRCSKCGPDDLMRSVSGVGCEYGVDWIIEHILETELEPANLEEAFEESVRQCYPEETKVGWMTFDTVTLIYPANFLTKQYTSRENDPVGWRCALVDYESQEESEGNIISFDNGFTYYCTRSLEFLIEQQRD